MKLYQFLAIITTTVVAVTACSPSPSPQNLAQIVREKGTSLTLKNKLSSLKEARVTIVLR